MSAPREVREELLGTVRDVVGRFVTDDSPAAALHYLEHNRDRLSLEELDALCRWAWDMFEETDPSERGGWYRVAEALTQWDEDRRALEELIRDCGGDPRGSP